jgi:hypothetical protein
LYGVGLAAVGGPWVVAVSERSGEWTTGASSREQYSAHTASSGYANPTPHIGRPYHGERWLYHNPWMFKVEGTVKLQPGFHVRQLGPNLREVAIFSIACPIALAGILGLLFGACGWSRSPQGFPVFVLGSWMLLILVPNFVVVQYLLYPLPALLVVGVSTLRSVRLGFPQLSLLRMLGICGLVSGVFLLRHLPLRPLGAERWSRCAEVRQQELREGAVWFPQMNVGLPIAFLLDRDIHPAVAQHPVPVQDPGLALVIWFRYPNHDWPLPEALLSSTLSQIAVWSEEDGTQVQVFGRSR